MFAWLVLLTNLPFDWHFSIQVHFFSNLFLSVHYTGLLSHIVCREAGKKNECLAVAKWGYTMQPMSQATIVFTNENKIIIYPYIKNVNLRENNTSKQLQQGNQNYIEISDNINTTRMTLHNFCVETSQSRLQNVTVLYCLYYTQFS